MMTTTKIQKNNLTATTLILSLLLSTVSFIFFKSFERSEPWFLMGLFILNSAGMSFALYKARKTGKIFLWGLGAKGLKTLVLFSAFCSICMLNLVEDKIAFATFFCLGFTALMFFEVKHIFKEFGKEIEC